MRALSFPSKLLRFYGSDEISNSNLAPEAPVSFPYPLGASGPPEWIHFSKFSASTEARSTSKATGLLTLKNKEFSCL
jgi:hypothetical protein